MAQGKLIAIAPVTIEERTALENLVELYTYDFSEYLPLDVDESGRFRLRPLDAFFRDADRRPFFIRVDGKLAGFALVTTHSLLTGAADVTDMTEFFVLRRYRRCGVGTDAACALFDRFVGSWEVRQRRENTAATAFWKRAIAIYTGGSYEDLVWNDAAWSGPVQRFVAGVERSRSGPTSAS